MSELKKLYEDHAMAAYMGRFHSHVLISNPDHAHAARIRGPLFRQEESTYGPRSYRRNARDKESGPAIVRGGRPISVTIGPGLDQETDHIKHLLEVAKLVDLDICAEAASDEASVRLLDVHVNPERHYGGSISITDGDHRQTSLVYGEGPSMLAELTATTEDREVRARLCLSLMAHDQLGRDLFVTDDCGLLEHRHNIRSIAATAGIVSAHEAVRLVYSVLRGRDKYILTGMYHVNEGLFYGKLTQRYLPSVTNAFRHTLHEARGDSSARIAASTLDSILSRFDALLVLADEVTRLHLSEGRQGGGNDYIARFGSILRESVTLYTASLDACALFIAQSANFSPADLKKAGWWKFKRGAGSFGLLNGRLGRMQQRTNQIDDTWAKLIWELRHRLHHRDEIRCVTTKIVDDGSTFATFTTLRCDELDDIQMPPDLDEMYGEKLVQPSELQHGLVRNLAAVLGQIFDLTDWPNADWYLQEITLDDMTERHHAIIGERAHAQWLWD